jgi:glutamate-1-semialdehyde 2,1-aminomutase
MAGNDSHAPNPTHDPVRASIRIAVLPDQGASAAEPPDTVAEEGTAITVDASPGRGAAGLPGGDIVTRWARENPSSAALHARAKRVLPGGVTHDVRLAEPFPLAVARAQGSRKWDLDGHELTCFVMGHGALLLGHGHPEVVAAVRDQAARSFHPGACHELESDWAEAVIRLVPSAERVRFTSSGTEASLLALRLARAVTGRGKIVKLAGHFHGWHDQAALGSDPPFDEPDTAGLPGQIRGSVAVIPADANFLAEALRDGDVAALILEPSGAAWGTVPLPCGFLQAARRAADRSGTLLIFDEVVSGFRWAPGGVQASTGVLPELTVLGKILAGGMPGGAVCGRADIMDHIGGRGPARLAHPGTHNAHPLSAAAGVATLVLASSAEVQDRAARAAAWLRSELSSVFDRCGVTGRAYGQSSTFHLLFGHAEAPEELDPATLKRGIPPRLSAALHCSMLCEGVHLFHGSGFVSSEHTDTDLERSVAALAATLPRLQSEGLV